LRAWATWSVGTSTYYQPGVATFAPYLAYANQGITIATNNTCTIQLVAAMGSYITLVVFITSTTQAIIIIKTIIANRITIKTIITF
jgi:hypothetical protein